MWAAKSVLKRHWQRTSAGTTRMVANRAATVSRFSKTNRMTASLKRFRRRPDGS